MSDDDTKAGGPLANRTIQIDALTDVQLVESAIDEDGPGAAPPPLPSKQPREASRGRNIALTFVAVVVGAASAFAVVHFLFPSAAPSTSAPPPVHRVQLDDELVIRSGAPRDP